MIGTSPAGVIRQHLEHAGSLEVPFHNLLTSWGVEEPTFLDREKMVTELTAAGVRASRPLSELAPDDVVALSLATSQITPLPHTWLDGPPAGNSPPAPPFAPAHPGAAPSPPPGRGRRWLRIALAVSGLILLLGGACVGGFFYGQETRLSGSEVEAKLERQGAHDKNVFTARAQASLAQQKRTLTRQRKEAVTAAQRRGQQKGYASGQQTGYASGNSAGFSAGHSTGVDEGKEAGVEEGLEKGSDELACSDDLDVPLPPCL